MKILLVHDYNPFWVGGGVETNTRYLASELQRMGNEVALGHQDKFGTGTISTLKTIPMANKESVVNTFKEFDYVILIGSMSLKPLFLIGAQILIKQKRKFIIYFTSSSLHRPFSERIKDLTDLEVDRLDAEMFDVIASPYSVVVAISSAMRVDLLKMYSVPQSKKIYILYPGTVWPKSVYRGKLDHDKFTFISVGRLTIDKGYMFLWEAFYHLYNELSSSDFNKKIELKVIGSGVLDRTLRFLTEEFSLSHSISFYGKVEHSEVFKHMATSHTLVHPALLEPFGNVIVEALGLGLPVIASDFEGPKEILENGKYGKLVPRANTWELKETMKEIVLNEKHYVDLVNKANKSEVRDKYSISNQACTLIDIIQSNQLVS